MIVVLFSAAFSLSMFAYGWFTGYNARKKEELDNVLAREWNTQEEDKAWESL